MDLVIVFLVIALVTMLVGVAVALYVTAKMEEALMRLDISRRPASELPLNNVDRVKWELAREHKMLMRRFDDDCENPDKVVRYLTDLFGPEWAEILQKAASLTDEGNSSPGE